MVYKKYSGYVKSVYIDDSIGRTPQFPCGRISLEVSKDGQLYYDSSVDNPFQYHESSLIFNRYVTKLRVPPHVGIEIPYSQRDIEGVIDSPTLIMNHTGDINLYIMDEKKRLILTTIGPVRINNKMVFHGYEVDLNRDAYYLGEDFESYQRRYNHYFSNKLQKPKIHEHDDRIQADFIRSKYNYFDVQVCMHFGLICIEKPRGHTNIFHNGIKFKDKSTEPVKSLLEQMKEAAANDDFETAAKIRDELKKRGELPPDGHSASDKK